MSALPGAARSSRLDESTDQFGETLEFEPRVDRLLRDLLAEHGASKAGVRTVARAIGITDAELREAKERVCVVSRKDPQIGATVLELAKPTGRSPRIPQPPLCGHPEMWRTEHGLWRCTTCHPPATPRLAHEITRSSDVPS